MVLVPMICFTSAFSKGYNGKRTKGFFHNFDLLVICANVLLECLLNLLMLDYVLLIMVYIVYPGVSVGETVVSDRVGQLSKFTV